MKSLLILFLTLLSIPVFSATDTALYFPPDDHNTEWATLSAESLHWQERSIQPLYQYLNDTHTKAFMILVNGKIVLEKYFNGHTPTTDWEWNSAGKTLVSATVGIAQQNGLLSINDKISDYLGRRWTNMPLQKENMITVKNLLSMTSGIDDSKQWVRRNNLTYIADAGSRWAYGNVFQKLMDVVAAASGQTFGNYFDEKIKNKIGMDGYWRQGTIYTIFHSTARSMARFGLLALNQGQWRQDQIIDRAFFTASIRSSQNINPSYGYFWWLNGKSSYMVPNAQTVYPTALIPNAPADLYAAMGAKDQRIYVIPSKKMVIIRMGLASNPSKPNFAVSGFDTQLWDKINAVIR